MLFFCLFVCFKCLGAIREREGSRNSTGQGELSLALLLFHQVNLSELVFTFRK